MLNTIEAVVKNGQILPLEEFNVPEGTKALITLLPATNENGFWLLASETALDNVWDNEEDDVYADLHKK